MKVFEVGKCYSCKVYEDNGWDYATYIFRIHKRRGNYIEFYHDSPYIAGIIEHDTVDPCDGDDHENICVKIGGYERTISAADVVKNNPVSDAEKKKRDAEKKKRDAEWDRTLKEGIRLAKAIREMETAPAENVTVEVETAPAENVTVEVETAPAENVTVEVETAPAENVTVEVETAPAENVTVEVETAPASEMQKNALAFSADGDEFVRFLKGALLAPSTLGRDIAPICIQANADGLGIRIINDDFSICAVAEGNEKIFSEGDVVIPRRAAEKLLGLARLDRYQFQVKNNMFLVDDADGKTILSLTTYAQGTKGHELFHRTALFGGSVEDNRFAIQKNALKDMLDKTTYAIGGKLACPQYQAIYFKAQGNELTISATDGNRMATANAHLSNAANATFSINRGAAEFLRKSLTNNLESPLVLINVGATEIQFRIDNLTLTTGSLKCDCPPFEKFILSSGDVLFTSYFQASDLMRFLKVAKSISQSAILEFSNGGIDMKAIAAWTLPAKTWQDWEKNVVAKQSIQASNESTFAFARIAISPEYLSSALAAQHDDGIIELTQEYIIVRTDNSVAVIAPMGYKIDGKVKTIEFANAPLKKLDVEIQNRAKQKVYASMQRQVPQIAANSILDFNSAETEYWKKEALKRCC